MCPWRAFKEPVVRDTLAAYRFFESGQLAEYWGHDPPSYAVEALIFYHGVSCRIRDKQYEAEKQKRIEHG